MTATVASVGSMGGWRHLWTLRRARLWLVALAVAAWLPILGVPTRAWLDFSAFYAAGKLAFSSALLELDSVIRLQDQLGLPLTPFVNPTGMALAYAPLAALPYELAAAAHMVAMFALLLGSIAIGASVLGMPLRWAMLAGLAWGPAAAGVLSGQNSSLSLFLVVLAGLALARAHDVRAGLAAGFLGYKPQLALPLVGLLLLRGRWAGFFTAVVVLVAHYVAGVMASGGQLDWPLRWAVLLDEWLDFELVENGWKGIGVPALGMLMQRATGLPGVEATSFILAGVIVVISLPALRRFSAMPAVALAAACGLVASPHALPYEATLLLPAMAIVATRAASRGWPWRDRWLVAAAYVIAATWPLGGVVGVTALPVLTIAMPFWLLEVGPFRPVAHPADASDSDSVTPSDTFAEICSRSADPIMTP